MKKQMLVTLTLGCLGLFLAFSPAKAKEVLPTDVAVASEDCTLVGVEGSYIVQAKEALARINAIRLEACKEGVPDPRDSSERLSLSDYKAIKWSSDLEYIARIRAAEASVGEVTWGHTRSNGKLCFDLTANNGTESYAEDLAWNRSSGMLTGIEQWYGEKTDWVKQNGNAVTGHYTSMIDPRYNYVAFATFLNSNALYYNTTSAEFSCESDLDEAVGQTKKNIIQTIEVKDAYLSARLTGMVLAPGERKTAALTLTANGSKVSPLAATWTSSNTSVAAVSASGTVTGIARGTATITARVNGKLSASAAVQVSPKVGTKYTVSGNIYKVTKAGAEVALVATKKNAKSLSIPATVKKDGITYKVTSIAKNAAKNNKKLKRVTIGKNVKKIAGQAFNKCKSLKTVTIKSTKIKSMSKKSFAGAHKKLSVKVPKKKKKAYRKLLKGLKVK